MPLTLGSKAQSDEITSRQIKTDVLLARDLGSAERPIQNIYRTQESMEFHTEPIRFVDASGRVKAMIRPDGSFATVNRIEFHYGQAIDSGRAGWSLGINPEHTHFEIRDLVRDRIKFSLASMRGDVGFFGGSFQTTGAEEGNIATKAFVEDKLIPKLEDKTSYLWNEVEDTHAVRNPVGRIREGMTTEQIKNEYQTISSLLSALLDIGPERPITFSITGVGLRYRNGEAEYMVGETASITLRLQLNKGRWVSADTRIVHEPALGNVVHPATWGELQLSTSLESTTPWTHHFTRVEDVRLPSTGNIRTSLGPTYVDNLSQSFTAEEREFLSVGNAPQIRSYLPVYIRGFLTTDVKVFADTSEIEVDDHAWDHVIQIPFRPSKVEQFEPGLGTDPWRQLTEGEDYVVEQVGMRRNHTYWSLTKLFQRMPRKLKISA